MWKSLGLVRKAGWQVSNEENVCELCMDIAEGGPYDFEELPVPIDDSHPGCRCVIRATEVAD